MQPSDAIAFPLVSPASKPLACAPSSKFWMAAPIEIILSSGGVFGSLSPRQATAASSSGAR